MKQTTLLIILASMLVTSCTSIGKKTSYSVPGVEEPVIKLNGTWKVNTHPAGEFWNQHAEGNNWNDILVPGELMMQGKAIKHNMPFAYKKEIAIPDDYSEKRIMLQFDGV